MRVACLSDMGRVRDINEDNYCCEMMGDCRLLVVADGMGGHNAGEVASKIAVKSIRDYINENIKDNTAYEALTDIIRESIQKANSDIYGQSIKNRDYSGMGTTVTSAVISNGMMFIGHVGDSRAYVLKNKKLHKITSDHSLVAELVKNGTITEDEAARHPQKNIITRALGTEQMVDVDIEKISIDDGDAVVLCTDGLTNMVSDREIEEILLASISIDDAVKEMVQRANEYGGHDNITVIVASAAGSEGEVRQ